MDSYHQASSFACSVEEAPLSMNSHRGGPANYKSNDTNFGPSLHEGFLNPESRRVIENRNYALGDEIREGQRQAFVGILDIYVHHARDIHNICIYNKQDVYAKLSLTSNPEGALSTQIANGGGRNPVFNENLQLKINSPKDESLRCEVWMLSRARNYLEDQLLGIALVPLATCVGKGKMTQDFTLSSTDLFHSPSGIVQLSISYHGSVPSDYHCQSNDEAILALSPSSISSEAFMLGHEMEDTQPTNYNEIEFPDLRVASENHQMVSEYIQMASDDPKPESSPKGDIMIADPNENELSGASFSPLGSFPSTADDYEMTTNRTSDRCADSSTAVAKVNNSFDYRADPDAEHSPFNAISSSKSSSSEGQKDAFSPKFTRPGGIEHLSNGTSLKDNGTSLNEETLSSKDSVKEGTASSYQSMISEGGKGMAFSTPLVTLNLEKEQAVVQQQIVDMYMKSMQQFTESLAKMKLPMDMESQESGDSAKSGTEQKNVQSGRNAGSRVFYGSRAFF